MLAALFSSPLNYLPYLLFGIFRQCFPNLNNLSEFGVFFDYLSE